MILLLEIDLLDEMEGYAGQVQLLALYLRYVGHVLESGLPAEVLQRGDLQPHGVEVAGSRVGVHVLHAAEDKELAFLGGKRLWVSCFKVFCITFRIIYIIFLSILLFFYQSFYKILQFNNLVFEGFCCFYANKFFPGFKTWHLKKIQFASIIN